MSTAIADALNRAGFDRLKFDTATFCRNFLKAGGTLSLWHIVGEEVAKETGAGGQSTGEAQASDAAPVQPGASSPAPRTRGGAGRTGSPSKVVVRLPVKAPSAAQLAARRGAGHSSVGVFDVVRLPSGRRYGDINTDEYVRLAVDHQQHATLLIRLRQLAVERGRIGGRFTTRDVLSAREFEREFEALRAIDRRGRFDAQRQDLVGPKKTIKGGRK